MTTQSLSSPLNKSISLSISLSTAAGMSWDVQWEEDVRDIWQLWSFRGSQSYRSWWLDRNSIGSTKNSEFKKIFAAFQTYFERSCTMDEFKCSFPVSALTFVQLWVAGCARSAKRNISEPCLEMKKLSFTIFSTLLNYKCSQFVIALIDTDLFPASCQTYHHVLERGVIQS